MADIELVIKIPEWKYKSICEGVEASKRCGVVEIDPNIHEAIYNSTPLPKRMLPVDLIIETLCPKDADYDYPCIAPSYLEEELERLLLDETPTIIGGR